jgi:hypothetical protein
MPRGGHRPADTQARGAPEPRILDRVNLHLSRALARVLRDLDSTGVPALHVEPSDWQTFEPSASAFVRSTSSGMGVWVDLTLGEAEQVAMVADQVQEFVVEDLPSHHLPANWPRCGEHPDNHPLAATVSHGAAVWVCPTTRRPQSEIGDLPR